MLCFIKQSVSQLSGTRIKHILINETKVAKVCKKMSSDFKLVTVEQELNTVNDVTDSTETGQAFSKESKGKQQSIYLRREKIQQAAKKKNTPYLPGTVNLQILGGGANGAPSSVYIFTDQTRYLFNCGEGTQRLAHEHKTKLARLEHIFVTRNTWQMIGGFPGLALTVQDAGVKELSFHGPPFLDDILQSMKRFVILKTLQIQTKDCSQEHDFEDNVMTVKSIPIYCNKSKSDNQFGKKVAISYICTLKPRPGTLNLEKCVNCGVPPGPLLGMLKNGIDITLNDGKVIKSSDVSEPGEKTYTFFFIDVPDINYLSSFKSQADVFLTSPQQDAHEIAVVVHFSPEDIVYNECYKSFINKFPSSVKHVYLNSSKNMFSGYIAAHRIQYKLNQLNPRIFPLLQESILPDNKTILGIKQRKKKLINSEISDLNDDVPENANIIQYNSYINSMTNFYLRPYKGIDHQMEAKLNPIDYINETKQIENFPTLIEELNNIYCSYEYKENYPRVTFLGTGSCIPNKTRNVSSILIELQENAFILLDCGEGTLGQIVRFFGRSKAQKVLQNLKAIYISHLHADHHIGLIGVLNERQILKCSEKLLLLAPRQIQSWLDFYNEWISSINDTYNLIGNGELLEQPYKLYDKENNTSSTLISTCLVRHCPHSFGVSLTLEGIRRKEKPVKITYSGDSMPCSDLIVLGENSTILIHEATMEDDLAEEAIYKMHSTISQAIEQGRRMNAEHIILTHFSQRYAKLPRMPKMINETDSKSLENVSIAFDNMQVSLEDLEHFHNLYPALKALFSEHTEELDKKALKRELKLERKRKLVN